MHFSLISLFPEMFKPLQYGIVGRALKKGFISFNLINPRDFSVNKHGQVDDKPYGGGPGLIMLAQPLKQAIDAARSSTHSHSRASGGKAKVIYLSPQGVQFNQSLAVNNCHQTHLVLIAGRYEGIDERIIATEVDEEWSIGDFILSGGELAAMVVIDTMARLIPGVVGKAQSVVEDSLSQSLLKYPQYSAPPLFAGCAVPDVLRSGDHARIKNWRLMQALGRTWLKRPDLLAKRGITPNEASLLLAFLQETLVK